MKERIFSDNFSEAIFAQAVKDDFERELAKLKEDETPVEFSERHERRMTALFARERRRDRGRRALVWARRVAAAAALVITLNGLLLTVPAVRAAMGTVIEWYDEYVQFGGGNSPANVARWEPSELPEGFSEADRVDEDTFTSITYADANGETLMFTRVPADNSVSVNNEGVEYGQTAEGETVYHTFTAMSEDGVSSVVWDAGGSRFCVGGRLPVEELLATARSVKAAE